MLSSFKMRRFEMHRRQLFGTVMAGVFWLTASNLEARNDQVTPEQFIVTENITFEVGRTVIAPDAFSRNGLRDAIESYNKTVRLPGLPDVFNAAILDPEKALAFVVGLSQVPGESRALISEKMVRLNSELQLEAYSGVTAQQLRDHLSLAPLEVNDNPRYAGVRVTTPISAELARRRIEEARKEVAARDELLRGLTEASRTHQALVERDQIRQARSSAAMVWLSLAKDLARQNPAAPDVTALVEAARKALEEDFVPPWGARMPGPAGQ